MTYGNGTFVAVGGSLSFNGGFAGTILTSPDGITWTSRIQGAILSEVVLGSVTYGNGTFVSVGAKYVIPGCEFLICEEDVPQSIGNIMLTSSDGSTWTSPLSPSPGFYSVTYVNGTFIAFGYTGYYYDLTGTMLTSSDGTTWTSRTSGIPGITQGLHAATYGNGTFMVVGDEGTILQSDPVK